MTFKDLKVGAKFIQLSVADEKLHKEVKFLIFIKTKDFHPLNMGPDFSRVICNAICLDDAQARQFDLQNKVLEVKIS